MSTKSTDVHSIEQILSEMTLEEKARIVTGGSPFCSEAMPEYGIPSMLMLDGGTGFNSLQFGGEMGYRKAAGDAEKAGTPIERETLGSMGGLIIGLREIQKLAAEKESHGETGEAKAYGCYPPGMLFGATWEPGVIEACGKSLGKEMQSNGVDMILGTPNVNIHRDPLNGRLFEGYSEDPFLVSKLAPAFVSGVQSTGVLANVKHFAANNQETNRMGVNEHIPERALREIYLPGFKACVDAGCKTVMSAYNKINGVACAMNKWLLTDVLRDEWGFDGFVVSDWAGAYDQVEALIAGNDLAMPGPRGINSIVRAVEDGQLKEEVLDTCVRNFLKVLLQSTAMVGRIDSFDIQQAIDTSEDAAREGITLLKNDGILPLRADEAVAFYGKRSVDFVASGAGSASVETSLLTNPVDSARALIGANRVTIDSANAETKYWIVTVGAGGQEGADRSNMEMDSDDKDALERAIAEASERNGNVILILNTSGPVSLGEYIDRVSAVVCAYFPGMRGGKVVSDVIFGKVNPSGKLPFTYPKYYRDTPTYKNFPGENKEVWYGEGIYVGYRYYDAKHIAPLFPFGFGLSYTTFQLGELIGDDTVDIDKQALRIQVPVKNTGSMAGSEVVQAYVHDVVSRIDKPEKGLKGFQKVFLQPGEEKIVTIEISKDELASYCMELAQWVTEPGEIDILVGTSCADLPLIKRVRINCSNPFGLTKDTGIGEVVANGSAVKMINTIIEDDIIAIANTAIVFAPDMSWQEVWNSSVSSAMKKAGLSSEEINNRSAKVLAGFKEL